MNFKNEWRLERARIKKTDLLELPMLTNCTHIIMKPTDSFMLNNRAPWHMADVIRKGHCIYSRDRVINWCQRPTHNSHLLRWRQSLCVNWVIVPVLQFGPLTTSQRHNFMRSVRQYLLWGCTTSLPAMPLPSASMTAHHRVMTLCRANLYRWVYLLNSL